MLIPGRILLLAEAGGRMPMVTTCHGMRDMAAEEKTNVAVAFPTDVAPPQTHSWTIVTILAEFNSNTWSLYWKLLMATPNSTF